MAVGRRLRPPRRNRREGDYLPGLGRIAVRHGVRVEVTLRYRPTQTGEGSDGNGTGGGSAGGPEWRKLATESGLLAEEVHLEATAEDLDPGQTYQYRAEAYLTNYDGQSRRVSQTFEVTAGDPCSGPSTNCLRVETLAPETSDSGGEVTLRGSVKGLSAYSEVTGHFFYRPQGSDEKNWTDYAAVEAEGGQSDDGGSGQFSATSRTCPRGPTLTTPRPVGRAAS